MSKLLICLDFDGVIHDYLLGWQDGSIYGNVTPGFFEWALEGSKRFRYVIYSARSKTEQGRQDMSTWMIAQEKAWRANRSETAPPLVFEYAHEKPAAFLTIDDRAVRFTGDWNDFPAGRLRAFRPWNASHRNTPPEAE